MIVLLNKKRNFRKYSVVFFSSFLKKKSYLMDPVYFFNVKLPLTLIVNTEAVVFSVSLSCRGLVGSVLAY